MSRYLALVLPLMMLGCAPDDAQSLASESYAVNFPSAQSLAQNIRINAEQSGLNPSRFYPATGWGFPSGQANFIADLKLVIVDILGQSPEAARAGIEEMQAQPSRYFNNDANNTTRDMAASDLARLHAFFE